MRSLPIKQRLTIKAAMLSQKDIPMRANCLCRIAGLDVCWICFRSVFLLHYSNRTRQLPLKKQFTQMITEFKFLAKQIPLFAAAQWACLCHWSRAKRVLIRPCRQIYQAHEVHIHVERRQVFNDISKQGHLSPGGTETLRDSGSYVECVWLSSRDMPKDTIVRSEGVVFI